MAADPTALTAAVRRLTERLSGVNPGWYAARAAGSAQHADSPETKPAVVRADVLRALVGELAELGRAAGTGAPAGAVPHDVGAHALPDQITVLAADIVSAPELTESLLERATGQVRAAYDALWV